MPVVRIPAPLRSYTSGNSLMEVSGLTVGEAMTDLARQCPELRQHLFNQAGELRPFVKLFLNQEDIRQLSGAQTRLLPEDELVLLASISGGSD